MSYAAGPPEAWSAEKKINYSDSKGTKAVEFIRHFAEVTWDQFEETIDGGVYDPAMKAELHAEVEVFRSMHWRPAQVEVNPRIRKFRRDLRGHLLKSLQEIDHFSAIGAHRVAPIGLQKGNRWRPWFGQRLVANFGRAAFGLIQGPPQKGKTNIGLYMGEQFALKDPQKNVVLSNIAVRNPPSWYRHVSGLSALFRAIVGRGPKSLPEGGFNPRWDPGLADQRMRFLWVFDEAGVVWKKKKATSNVSSVLETVAKHLGKNDGNILFIEQTMEGVPTIIQGFTRNRYRAIAPGIVQIDQGDREDHRTELWEGRVYDFPKTPLSYDPDDRAPFVVDIDIDALNESLAGSTNQVAAIRRYLDKLEERGEREDQTPPAHPRKPVDIEALKASREARIPWEVISTSTGVGISTLKKRHREAMAEEAAAHPHGSASSPSPSTPP